MNREKYKNSGLLPSPPTRLLNKVEVDTMLNAWHYLGSVRGFIFAVGHDEGCCVFTNCRSRIYESNYTGRVVELGRMVGSPGHKWSMTSLMSKSIRECRRRAYTRVITYADPWNGNGGTVYLAAGWKADGFTSRDTVYLLDGKRVSRRTFYDKHGTQSMSEMMKIYGNRLTFQKAPPKPRFILDL